MQSELLLSFFFRLFHDYHFNYLIREFKILLKTKRQIPYIIPYMEELCDPPEEEQAYT